MTHETALGASYRKLFISTTISNIGDGMSLIAYPWLASALTRNPLLISAVALVQRLPWLVFTLPAGVITDRVDRKKAMVLADFVRFGLTLVVALAVLSRAVEPARGRRAVDRHGHGDRPVHPAARRHAAARHRRGAPRQLRPDVHAVDRRGRAVGEGQRSNVERRDHRQHVHRPAARIAVADRRVLTALLRRRRIVLRRGCTGVVDSRQLPRRTTR